MTKQQLRIEAEKALQPISGFIGNSQKRAIVSAMLSEEGQYFFDKIREITNLINSMPKTYEQDGLGDKAIAYLHYFRGSYDAYITEKDMEQEQLQAFGLVKMNGECELGYVSIVEITECNVELDLHFTPKTLGEIKGKDLLHEVDCKCGDCVEYATPAYYGE